MKKEEIDKLVLLQQKIETLEGAMTKLSSSHARERIKIMVPKVSEYWEVPMYLVPNLNENIRMVLLTEIEEKLEELNTQMNELTLCKKVQEGESHFKPTEI